MATAKKITAILLIHCPDKIGIVAATTNFLLINNGNIVDVEQHVEKPINHFFMRVEWEMEHFNIPREKIYECFGNTVGDRYKMKWQLHFTDKKPRMAILVSKLSHCLYDILQRYESGEWEVEIPIIMGNHENLRNVAHRYKIDYQYFSISKNTKEEQEQKEIELLKKHNIDFIVLARYMQILSANFVSQFPNRIINIHHSFLPAFIGGRPYHAAHERGVKVIGATSHYVTSVLDQGPIIAQQVENVSHKKSVEDLIRKGKNLEKMVLSEAIWFQLQHKILPYQNRTIVFS